MTGLMRVLVAGGNGLLVGEEWHTVWRFVLGSYGCYFALIRCEFAWTLGDHLLLPLPID